MNRTTLPGVRITQGPSDWQILQRRLNNCADIPLAGTWYDPSERMAEVELRLVDETTGRPAAAHLDWHAAAHTQPDRTWRHVLTHVPKGGPYRIETRLSIAAEAWRLAGDQLHHIGVGDLWLIMGDDNAYGFGHGAVADAPEFGVHLFRRNERWSLASHPLHDVTGLRNNRFFSSGAPAHSPWLTFARLIRRETGLPVGLIPAGHEGSLLEHWNNPRKNNPSPALDNTLALLHAASSFYDFANFSLLDGGPRMLPKPEQPAGVIAGCVWYHGNGDTRREGAAATYAMQFQGFIDKLRTVLEAPYLPFVVCQLNRVIGVSKPGESPLWGQVREAQREAAHARGNVAVVPTLDAPLTDGVHNSAAGNIVIGERAARAALGMVYDSPVPWKSPEMTEIVFENDDRAKLVITFANVAGELRPVSSDLSCLTVGDASGGAPVRRVRQLDNCRLHVTLNRELGDGPFVTWCGTHNPVVAFVDDNNCPPLACWRFPVREPEKEEAETADA